MFKQMVRKALVTSVEQRGYQMIPFWKMDGIALSNHLRKLFEQYSITTVLDVGANKGQYHDYLREEVGFKGRILSFEPVSNYIELLNKRLPEDPLWTVFPFALGSATSTAEINVTRSPGLNSFLDARTDVVEGYWGDGDIVRVETVSIRTLDDALAEAGIDCAAEGVYLKLDTQGFDLEVVKGGARTLPLIRALQTEASIRPIYQNMPTYLETIAAMDKIAFELSGMFPVNHDDHLRLIELDFVFINHAFIPHRPAQP